MYEGRRSMKDAFWRNSTSSLERYLSWEALPLQLVSLTVRSEYPEFAML